MPSIAHLVRPDIATLEPYTPIVPLDVLAARLGLPVECIIKLDANENPYGPSPRALTALAEQETGGLCSYAIYPDPQHTQMRQALSRYTGQPVERIICGAGADEVIDMLLRLMLQPGDVVLDCPPTFGMYRFDTAVCGGRVVDVPRRDDFSLDVTAIARVALETQAKVLFVAAPNNPDGSMPSLAAIEALLELPLLVVVDEAYVEFAGGGVSHLVGQYENLVVLRTFSKWAGLAGLRLGYGLVPEALINHLWKIKQPYNVNVAAQIAALASLDDLEYLLSNVARLVTERERMAACLCDIPCLHVYPSQTNFLLCRVHSSAIDNDALHLKQALEREGILVRHYRHPRLHDCIRISIGRPEQNEQVLEALHRIQ